MIPNLLLAIGDNRQSPNRQSPNRQSEIIDNLRLPKADKSRRKKTKGGEGIAPRAQAHLRLAGLVLRPTFVNLRFTKDSFYDSKKMPSLRGRRRHRSFGMTSPNRRAEDSKECCGKNKRSYYFSF
uniref:Uncharacterized protein n=1 Tax=Pseudopediastrum sp. CL0201VA TaxID=2184484 RepID=A0A2U8GJT0_9CHLO|nr:hypothetical protein [Pseudopediastrum sp. CL0201VA]AWI68916.1 hypothetical protein [Pseudopediastrum sp. CL0201VA]